MKSTIYTRITSIMPSKFLYFDDISNHGTGKETFLWSCQHQSEHLCAEHQDNLQTDSLHWTSVSANHSVNPIVSRTAPKRNKVWKPSIERRPADINDWICTDSQSTKPMASVLVTRWRLWNLANPAISSKTNFSKIKTTKQVQRSHLTSNFLEIRGVEIIRFWIAQ